MTTQMTSQQMTRQQLRARKRIQTRKTLKQTWILYLFLLPALTYIIIFCYGSMFGLQIAFKNYRLADGFFGGKWVGLKWFKQFIEGPRFLELLKNTLILSLYSMLAGFPLPILLALVLNNVRNAKYKKFAQTITYMPHFISTTVLVGMMTLFFSPSSGFINTILRQLGGSGNTFFMGEAKYFSHMYVWSGVWKNMGWSAIIYIAAISGVDEELYEAARIDGAGRFARIWHVTLPGIRSIIAIQLILAVGAILNVSFDQIFILERDMTLDVGETLDYYVYRVGLSSANNFSLGTASGMVKSVIGLFLVIGANAVCRKLTDEGGIW